MLQPYGKGAWRLARHKLHRTVLTYSHLLILHNESSWDGSNLRAPDWKPDQLPARSRKQALDLAVDIASQLHCDPSRFAEFVTKYSEDVVTKDRGGSLGTWSAPLVPAAFLDAFQVMRPGDVSRVLETPLGFHIVMLRETPPEEKVAARRVLISYKDTSPFWRREQRGLGRSRQEALSMAQAVAAAARHDPSSFSRLIDEHSDHEDYQLGGHFGTWSTHHTYIHPREIEAIRNLKIGEVAEPVDGFEGFSVFIREPMHPEQSFAVVQIAPRLKPGFLTTEIQALELARNIQTQLEKDSDAFESLSLEYCCQTPLQWRSSRGVPVLEAAARHLSAGQVHPFPVKFGPADYRFIKRMNPKDEPEERALSSLMPNPKGPDIAYLVRNATDGPRLADYVRELHRRLGKGLGIDLGPSAEAAVHTLLEQLFVELARAAPEQRMPAIERTLEAIRGLLGDAPYRRYYSGISNELKRDLVQ